MHMQVSKRPFSRLQLVFIVEAILAAAFDRIEAVLPFSPDEIPDYEENRAERLNLIEGHKQVVAMALPVLYAQLLNDGMGIGDFEQYEVFERRADNFIARRTDRDKFDKWEPHPGSRDIAEDFVSSYFNKYLKEHWNNTSENPDFPTT